jgi:phosphoribosylanthranilate isomerase
MKPARVRIKICGITNQGDAEAAIELGADALGFNTYSGSKRCIDLRKEAGWIGSLPPFVTRVAVMVNPTGGEAAAVFDLPFIDAVQFHGNEDDNFCAVFAKRGLPFIKAISAKDEGAIAGAGGFSTSAILLDAHVPGEFGGTGSLVDLKLAASFSHQHPRLHLILSGGLTPANVAEAIRVVRPYAVDVASGVEANPRSKDRIKMRDFIAAARSAFSDL